MNRSQREKTENRIDKWDNKPKDSHVNPACESWCLSKTLFVLWTPNFSSWRRVSSLLNAQDHPGVAVTPLNGRLWAVLVEKLDESGRRVGGLAG